MEDLVEWLERSIERLGMQVDQFDAEIESFYMGNKKKKLDRDKQDIVDELSYRREKHKMHIGVSIPIIGDIITILYTDRSIPHSHTISLTLHRIYILLCYCI